MQPLAASADADADADAEFEQEISTRRTLVPTQTCVMGIAAVAHQPRANASLIGLRRERLSIDFRRHGPALAAIARSRRMTTAALARSILGEWLMTQSVDSAPVGTMSTEPGGAAPLRRDAPVTKLTLRMPADRAAKLARAARAAELSQGMYVVQLLDSQSDAPLVAGPMETLAALVRSNAKLAALNSDLNALARALKRASSPELADLNVLVSGLIAEVSQHLASAAPQVAALPASWRRPARKPD